MKIGWQIHKIIFKIFLIFLFILADSKLQHNRLTVRETCDIVRHIKPLGEVDFSGEIFFSPRSVITAWRFFVQST